MKQIEKVSIWDNGTTQSAEKLYTYGTNTTLGVSADFYYMLYTKDNQVIATGSVKMDGEDYQKWSDSDDYAWEFIATKLNLVIVGDWVEPIKPIVLTTNMKVGMGITDPSAKLEVTEPIVEESLTVEGVEEVVEAPVADVAPEV